MTFNAPSLEDLRAQGRADIEDALNLGPLLPKSVLGSISDSVAAHAHLAHLHLTDLGERRLLPTESADSDVLDVWAGLLKVPRKAAAAATGIVDLSGSEGSVLPGNSILIRGDGAEFTTDAAATIAGGVASVAVTASAAGAAGDTAAASTLTISSPVAGVDPQAVVDGDGLTGGTEIESDANLLLRIRQRLQDPPLGGAVADYIRWALEVPDVTRAFVDTLVTLGNVAVGILTDDAPGGPIPSGAKVAEVQSLLDDGSHAPVGVNVTVYAPTQQLLNAQIQLIGADTQVIRDAIDLNLKDVLREVVKPGGTVPISRIREAISTAPGEVDHSLVSPVADIVLGAGEILALGTTTWL